jgi:hypothetical protein
MCARSVMGPSDNRVRAEGPIILGGRGRSHNRRPATHPTTRDPSHDPRPATRDPSHDPRPIPRPAIQQPTTFGEFWAGGGLLNAQGAAARRPILKHLF